ncbi:hypothetical protein [Roseibium sp.]|uniref:hypothetical protein n=1 Tax=Roseibium sp. TaxID=1936156 RepID=UPI003D0BA0DB
MRQDLWQRNMQSRIRDLEGQIIRLEGMIRDLIRTATVDEYDPKTDRAIVSDETEGDEGGGKATTPPARVLGQAGGVKKRTTLTKGEQVVVINPNGNLGETSLILPLGPNEENPSPSDHGAEDLTIIGGTKIQAREETYDLTSGTITCNADTTTVNATVHLGAEGGPKVARVGDKVLVAIGSSAGLWSIVTGASKTHAV